MARDANADEIKKAFRKLARLHHPDVAKDKTASDSVFKSINEANEVLSDLSAGGNLEGDLVVAQNVAFAPALAFEADPVGHVVLGSRDPENAAQGHLEQMIEVDVSFVEDRDLTGLQGGAERPIRRLT